MNDEQSKQQRVEARYVYPDPKVFSVTANLGDVVNPSNASLNRGSAVFVFKEAIYPDEGGIFREYYGTLFPEKGFAVPQAIHACNMSKRYLLGHLRMFAKSKKLMLAALFEMENIIKVYNDACEMNLRPFYYDAEYPRYYSKPCKEMREFLLAFLMGIGISFYESGRFAKNFMTMIGNDNAYEYRIQDVAGITTKDKLLKDFIGESERIFKEYCKRENPGASDSEKSGMVSKFGSIVKIAKIAWLIPKFRNAVKEGIEAVNWDNLVMTDADKYHTLLWIDYNYQGRTVESRRDEFVAMHPEGKLPMMVGIR